MLALVEAVRVTWMKQMREAGEGLATVALLSIKRSQGVKITLLHSLYERVCSAIAVRVHEGICFEPAPQIRSVRAAMATTCLTLVTGSYN